MNYSIYYKSINNLKIIKRHHIFQNMFKINIIFKQNNGKLCRNICHILLENVFLNNENFITYIKECFFIKNLIKL